MVGLFIRTIAFRILQQQPLERKSHGMRIPQRCPYGPNRVSIGIEVSVQKELAVCTSILDFRRQTETALYVNPLIACQMNAQLQAEKRMLNVKRFGKNTRIEKNKQLKNLKESPKAKKGKVRAKEV